MKYFEGVEILFANEVRQCRAWVDKYFDGYYVVDYCERGSLEHRVESDGGGEQHSVIEAGTAWLTFPGPRFRFGSPPEGADRVWHHRCVGFKGPRAERMVEEGLFPVEAAPVELPEPESFRLAFDRLIGAAARIPFPSARVVHLLEGLLVNLQEQRRLLERGLEGRRISLEALMEGIYREPSRDWDFRVEAERIEVSYHHFRRLWRQETGAAPQEFVLRARLERAASLIREGGMGLKEVAWESGFVDPAYFYRSFKAYWKATPGGYRRRVASGAHP